MLSNKEISENFEVQISTLYNWRKTKPRLYRYLKNADYNFEQSKEINILLDRFAKEISGELKSEEIEFFINTKFEAQSIDDIENMPKLLLIQHNKEIAGKNGPLLFGLYDKLRDMNIIEKYIFYKRVYNIRAEQNKITKELIEEYFQEFLS